MGDEHDQAEVGEHVGDEVERVEAERVEVADRPRRVGDRRAAHQRGPGVGAAQRGEAPSATSAVTWMTLRDRGVTRDRVDHAAERTARRRRHAAASGATDHCSRVGRSAQNLKRAVDSVADPMATGAQVIVDELERAGVEVCFGLPGVHNLALWEALRSSSIRLVGVRHEQAAAYAADGYARATGRLGVALTTTGPGAANTLGAVGEAWASRSPILVIATDIPSSAAARGRVPRRAARDRRPGGDVRAGREVDAPRPGAPRPSRRRRSRRSPPR